MAGAFTDGDNSSPDYDRAASMITDHLGGAPPNSFGGGGKFALSPDELRNVIKDWANLASSYNKDIEDAQTIKRVQPAGQDDPSRFFTTVVHASGDALHQSLQNEQEFCHRQAQRFQAALDAYLSVEATTKESFDKQDPGTVL